MKTISLKKVSAVAVASLGFGLLSVVPANAAALSVTSAIKLTASDSPTAGAEVSVTVVAGVTSTAGATDTATLTAYLSAKPNGAGGSVTNDQTADTTECDYGADDTSAAGTTDLTLTSKAGQTCAAGAITFGVVKFTPALPGTYTLTVWNEVATAGQTIGEEVASLNITVAAEAAYSNTLSTAFITPGLGGTGADFATTPAIATADVAVNANSTMAAAARASITVKLFDSSNTAMVAGKVSSITAEVSGPGGVIVNADNVPAAPTCSTTLTSPNGRSVTFTSEDEINHVYVCADGTPGVSTIKISVTDLLGVKTTLSTKTVTFYGKVTTIVATGVLTVGTAAGGTTGNPAAARTSSSVTPSIIVKATDSASNPVSGLTFTYKSSNTAVMTETLTCNEDIKATANTSSSGGSGFYNCQVTSSSGAKSGDKATLTVRIVDPAGDGTTFLTSAVDFTIGGSATTGTETIAFDKTSYAPGEAMVITRTAKDSAGNPVADGTASPNFSFNKGITGTPAAGTYAKGVSASASSVAKSTIFAPVTPGSFIVTATAANGATITATATVTDANAALVTQIDALNAKIVALNALIAKIMKKLGVK